jgi:hypothetical protein
LPQAAAGPRRRRRRRIVVGHVHQALVAVSIVGQHIVLRSAAAAVAEDVRRSVAQAAVSAAPSSVLAGGALGIAVSAFGSLHGSCAPVVALLRRESWTWKLEGFRQASKRARLPPLPRGWRREQPIHSRSFIVSGKK